MIKQETVNTFHDGMIMDLNPLVTPNNVVTNALNATLVTMNGNENVLQNDMGNGRIETAYLPEGYVPLGTAQLGGIIYVVSYNPLSKKCQIGSFPSPERNITSDEFIGDTNKKMDCSEFYTEDAAVDDKYRFVSNPYQKLILTDQITLHPGDKFQIYSPEISEAADYISAFNQSDHNPDHNPDLLPKYLKFNVMAITDDGKMTNLNNTLVWQPLTEGDYYIRNDEVTEGNYKNIDEYRNLVQSNYNVFQTKTSGKLGIVAELECISSFDVSWDALKEGNTWKIYLYTNWTYNNDYSKDQINLFGVYYKASGHKKEEKVIVIKDYPTSQGKSDTNIQDKNGVTFYNPPYISNIEEYLNENKGEPTEPTEPRNNDGTDNQFLIRTPITVSSTSEKGAMLNLSIMPLMPFGILQWMEQNISINLSKLGTGSVDLVQYKYYVEDELVQLSWGLEAYPERNKSINNVTFNFYKLNSDILESIKNSGQKIDNNRLCNNKWQEYNETKQDWTDSEEESNLSLGNPVKSIINEGQSSYSGFFTEKFSKKDLIENYVYLVEISIDYNKEKTIKYYRIFYNSSMFNDYYYKDNYSDFKEIVLDDELQKQIQYTLKMDTQINEVSTEFNGEVPQISDEPYTEFQKYNIEHKYYGQDTGVLYATVNDIFEAEVSKINIPSQTHILTNNAQAEQISSSSISPSITVDKISELASNDIKTNNDTITNNFRYDITIPLQMTYNTKSQLNISYELVHATCTYYWMIYRGRDKYHHLSLYPNITNIDVDDYYIARDSFGDNTKKNGTMSTTYTNCYNQLSQLLDKYDIVALPTMAVRGISGKGSKSVSIGFSLGSANNWNINSTTETSWSETLQNNFCGLFYAMKTQDGQVIVFSFDGKKGPAYFPNVILQRGFECLRARSNEICEITDNKSYNDNEIPEYIFPLRGYYIPREYTGSISKYQWTILEYYPSFLETSSYDITGTSDITLSINSGIKLNPGIEVNNLKYTTERDFTVSYKLSWEVPTSNLISTLTDLGSDVYVVLPDGTLSKDIVIGRNNVYDYKGNKISSITNWSSADSIPVISEMRKSSNTMTLCVVDERLRIKQNLVSSGSTGTIAGRSENQKISIQQIPIIPYVQL